MPVVHCGPPPESRLMRKVDQVFVTTLKNEMLQDSTGTGVPPAVLLCKTKSKDGFQVCHHNHHYLSHM